MIAKIIISQDFEKRVAELTSTLEKFKLSQNHPDVLYIQAGEKLGIETVRKIKVHFSYKATQGLGKATVLEDAENITVEAQNALLKTLEELPEPALFLIGAPSTNGLLPTVLSRCQISVITGNQIERSPDYAIDDLLTTDIKHRFLYIEKLKDKEDFLKALLYYFRKKLIDGENSGQGSKDIHRFTNLLLEAERWANQNVNIRGILEYLMLNMPLHKG